MEKEMKDGTPQWGVFSMKIPGRVGYQCSNFYRQLVKNREINDTFYELDDKGHLHCKFGKGCRKRSDGNGNSNGNGNKKKKKRWWKY